MLKINFFGIVLLTLVGLSACQTQQSTSQLSSTQEKAFSPSNTGPTSGPETMKGPPGPPPSNEPVTEKENVQFTLEKTGN